MSFTESIRRGTPGALLIGAASGVLAGILFNRRVTVLTDVAAAALVCPIAFFGFVATQYAVSEEWIRWRGKIATAAALFLFFGTCRLFDARPEEVAMINGVALLVVAKTLRQARQWGWSVP